MGPNILLSQCYLGKAVSTAHFRVVVGEPFLIWKYLRLKISQIHEQLGGGGIEMCLSFCIWHFGHPPVQYFRPSLASTNLAAGSVLSIAPRLAGCQRSAALLNLVTFRSVFWWPRSLEWSKHVLLLILSCGRKTCTCSFQNRRDTDPNIYRGEMGTWVFAQSQVKYCLSLHYPKSLSIDSEL